MRHASTAVIIVGVIGVLASPAWAGVKVETIAPQVSINRGQGYKVVTASTEVSTGDQVMVGPGGHGKIVYADGCAVDVYPGKVVAVPGKCYEPMRAGLEAAPVVPVAVPWWPIVLIGAGAAVGICAVSDCFEEPPSRSHDGGHGHH